MPTTAESPLQQRTERTFFAENATNFVPLDDSIEALKHDLIPKEYFEKTEMEILQHIRKARLTGIVAVHERARTLWDNLKLERNARIAIILDALWPRFMYRAKKNFKLIRERMKSNSGSIQVSSNTGVFRGTLANFIQRPSSIVKNSTFNHEKNIKRLDTIVSFGEYFGWWRQLLYQPAATSFIERGFNTASATNRSFLLTLVHFFGMHRIPMTKKNIRTCVEHSVRYLPFMASLHLVHGPPLLTSMTDAYPAPTEKFKLEYWNFDPTTLTLSLNKEALHSATTVARMGFRSNEFDTKHILSEPMDTPTTGCPVRSAESYARREDRELRIFKDLAFLYADMLIFFINHMTENEKDNFERACDNFLSSIA